MAGAEERISFVLGDQVDCDTNRSTRLSTHGNGRFRHLDDVWRVNDVDLKLTPIAVALERRRNRGGGPNEKKLQVEMTGGGKSTVHDGGRRVVATHRVNGDANRKLFLFDRSDLPLPVKAAMRANPMRSFRLVALRAQIGGGSAQRIVRTAL
jgi:hypothetical protein